jgi:chorismate mutase
MQVRGVRGAINISADEADVLIQATQELLNAILEANPGLRPEDLASVLFTTTPDLSSAYPARAARMMGWERVPLLCFQEMVVLESMARVIRVLLHWNTDLSQESVTHVYLGETTNLRPDLSEGGSDDPGNSENLRMP